MKKTGYLGMRFKKKLELVVTLIISMFLTANAAHAQQHEPDLVANQALPTLVTKVFPGTQYLASTSQVAMPDGSKKTLLLPVLIGHPIPAGWMYVAGMELQEDQETGFQALDYSLPAQSTVPSYLVVFTVDNSGVLKSYVNGVLDSKALITQLADVYFPLAPQDGSWPKIQVVAWHWYQTPSWIGSVRFSSTVDTSNMSTLGRSPVALLKSSKDGSSNSDYLKLTRSDASTLLIQGALTNFSLSYPCVGACAIDPVTLLNSF